LALDEGVEFLLLNCTPALVGLYERLGARRYAPNFVDPEYGYRVPLVLLTQDAEHLKRVRSPLYKILASSRRPAPAPSADYRWFENLFGRQSAGEFQLEDDSFWSFLASHLLAADLNQVRLLQGLTDTERMDVLERSTVLRYRKGDFVVRA